VPSAKAKTLIQPSFFHALTTAISASTIERLPTTPQVERDAVRVEYLRAIGPTEDDHFRDGVRASFAGCRTHPLVSP
jgi:hypothetical protein